MRRGCPQPPALGSQGRGLLGLPPCHPPSPPPSCSSGFSRDGGLVPKGVGGTSPMLAWSMGRRMLWSAPSLLPPFSPYFLGVVVVFLPRLLLFLLWHLALPPAQPAGRGALPITVDPWRFGYARLGQVALEKEQKATTRRELAGPIHPILLSLRISRGALGCVGSRGFHLCTWEEILRAAGSSGILALVREGIPTTVLGGRGEVPPSPHLLWASAGAFCFRKDVMARP